MAHIPPLTRLQRQAPEISVLSSLFAQVDEWNAPARNRNSRGAIWPQVAILEVTLQGI